MRLHVTIQFVSLGERFVAEGTLEGLVTSMSSLVVLEVGLLHEGLVADGTMVWRNSSTTDIVVKFVLVVAECSHADCAFVALR